MVSDEIEIITRSDFDRDEASKEVDPRYVDGDGDDVGQEIDVEETIAVEERGPEPLKTLLTGLPSPTALAWTALTFGLNLALVLMTLDFVYRPYLYHQAQDLSFARVGYVGDSTARVLVREPDAGQYPLFASFRYADPPNDPLRPGIQHDTAWKSAGRLDWLDESTDFTGTFTIKGLRADIKYQYVVSNNHSGHFTTAPKVGYTTSRIGGQGAFTFLHSSCLKNNFPYSPFEHPLSNQGLRYLGQVLQAIEARFMLFLGDFIYIDVPRRHGQSSVEDYRRNYRQIYASPDWADVSRNLPWIHVYDDHEISNDWDRNTTGFFNNAVDPYQHYHTSVNPPPVRPDESYFEFTHGPATFFMLDTRRYRSPNDDTNGSDPTTGEATKTMLGARQLADLLAWLRRPEPAGVAWKIVVSSVPFTQNWQFGAQDTWRGYLGERQVILEAMWDVGARGGVGVVVLSGDRHEFAATAFPPPPAGKEVVTGLGQRTQRKRWPAAATVHEFSASPLNMFYLPVRTYAESTTDADHVSDVCVKYIPDGNSKFAAVSISSAATSEQSIFHYRLYVDGQEAWSHTLTTPPDTSGEARNRPIWG